MTTSTTQPAESAEACAWEPSPATVTASRWHLLEVHRSRLRRLAVSRLGDSHDAEDVVSEAIMRAATFARLREEEAGAFLTSTTLRLCADLHRARARQSRALHRMLVEATSPHPDEHVCDAAEAHWLSSRLADLPSGERAAIAALAAGMKPSVAARELGVSLKAFECALARGRRRLKQVWRTTLSIYGLTAFRRLRPARAGGLAPAAAAAAAVAVTASLWTGWVSAPIGPVHSPAWTGSRAYVAQLRSIPRRARLPVLVGPRHGQAATEQRRPTDVPITKTAPVGDPRLVGTKKGVEVKRDHPDKTFLQSVQDCLHGGLVVSTTVIGCPGTR